MKILFEDAVCVDNRLIFFCRDINLLCSIQIDNGQLEILGKLPEEKLLGERLCGGIAVYNNNIVIAPLKARNIWIFSLDSCAWKQIELKEFNDGLGKSFFRSVYIYNNKAFFFGGYYPAIVILNLDTYEIEYISEVFDEKGGVNTDLFFRSGPVVFNDRLYLASSIDNSVLVIDLKLLTYEWKKVGDKDDKYSGIVFDDGFFWLSPRKGKYIIRWDGYNIKKIEIPHNEIYLDILYSGIYLIDDHYLITTVSNSLLGSLFVYKREEVYNRNERYSFVKTIGPNQYMFQLEDGKIVIHNDEIGYLEHMLEFDDAYIYKLLKEKGLLFDGKKVEMIMLEHSCSSLNRMLSLICE